MNLNGFNSGAEHAWKAHQQLERDLSQVAHLRTLLAANGDAAPLVFRPSRTGCPPHVGDLDRLPGDEVGDLVAALRQDARRLLAEVHRTRTRERARRRSEVRPPRGRHGS